MPKINIHYSRNVSSKKCLCPDISVYNMCHLFKQKHLDNPANSILFNNISKGESNLRFVTPRSDTYKQCDQYLKKINFLNHKRTFCYKFEKPTFIFINHYYFLTKLTSNIMRKQSLSLNLLRIYHIMNCIPCLTTQPVLKQRLQLFWVSFFGTSSGIKLKILSARYEG